MGAFSSLMDLSGGNIFMVLQHIVNDLVVKDAGGKKTAWPESASELDRPSGRRLSAKLLPSFADRGCHVVSVTDPYSRILGFLDRSHYFSIK
jgi:hypothetical protein